MKTLKRKWFQLGLLILFTLFGYTLNAHFAPWIERIGRESSCTQDSIDACKDKSGVECERCCDRECQTRCSKLGETVVEKCRNLCHAKCPPY